jgi:hypothetical protein
VCSLPQSAARSIPRRDSNDEYRGGHSPLSRTQLRDDEFVPIATGMLRRSGSKRVLSDNSSEGFIPMTSADVGSPPAPLHELSMQQMRSRALSAALRVSLSPIIDVTSANTSATSSAATVPQILKSMGSAANTPVGSPRLRRPSTRGDSDSDGGFLPVTSAVSPRANTLRSNSSEFPSAKRLQDSAHTSLQVTPRRHSDDETEDAFHIDVFE